MDLRFRRGVEGAEVLRHPGFASQPMGGNSKKPREDLEVVIKKEFESIEFRCVFKSGH